MSPLCCEGPRSLSIHPPPPVTILSIFVFVRAVNPSWCISVRVCIVVLLSLCVLSLCGCRCADAGLVVVTLLDGEDEVVAVNLVTQVRVLAGLPRVPYLTCDV